jgi:branched-chain amino acid transport system permease protein
MPREIAFHDLWHDEASFPSLWRTGACVLLLCLACSIPGFAPQFSGFASMVLLYVLLATGLNLELRLGGLPDFAYVSWFAVGAYSDALIARYSGLPFWVCLPFAMFLAALGAVFVTSALLRRRLQQFGILTLGFGVSIQIILSRWAPFSLLKFPTIPADVAYWILVAATVAAMLVSGCVRHSPLARVLRAARQDEIACHSIGVDIGSCRLSILVIGAAMAGGAGCLFAAGQGSVGPDDFDVSITAVVFMVAMVGGRHGQLGIIFAAIALAAMLQLLPAASEYRLLIAGAGLVSCAIWRAIPKGNVAQTEHGENSLTAAEIGAE